MEVFQQVLVKMVHTAVIEGKDPRREVKKYLAAYRAAPHKTTGKSPYELMFGRKMMTKLPQVEIKPEQKLDEEVQLKHDKENKKQKDYLDKRKKVEG